MTRYECRHCVYGNLAKRSFRCDSKIFRRDSDIRSSIFRNEKCPTYEKEREE